LPYPNRITNEPVSGTHITSPYHREFTSAAGFSPTGHRKSYIFRNQNYRTAAQALEEQSFRARRNLVRMAALHPLRTI
jgi:hypothetical protein